ncbi:CBF/Mak21 family-domain-containing protein [Cercophora newfieldiana]|uniref:CBF/Mak21 family-domain-containing protein n=1 Tax=Cercophora newfieldiana TaxID=92897 RepID=A0AA39YRF4_9PEZI|nr:CBF/Mak21 family-domain-containing protein [Cercophora newfieldiana]
MGANRTKQKKKAASTNFDQNALAQLTAKLDTALPSKPDSAPLAKRKRSREADDEPGADNGAKKRQARKGAKPQRDQGSGDEAQADDDDNDESENLLLKEILALGGDEDDYNLVANVDSGDEGDQAPAPKAPSSNRLDLALQEELAKFASALGFQQHRPDDGDDDIDVSGDDEEEPSRTPEKKPKVKEVEKLTAVAETRQAKSSGKLVFEPRADWYSIETNGLPSTVPSDSAGPRSAIANLKAFAEELLEKDASAYATQQSSRSTQKFMSTIMSSGTFSDKVSALTLSIQESPVHNRKAFESLITLAGKKSRGQAVAALGALVDLLGNGVILPEDRRLRPFEGQPALLATLLQSKVAVWNPGQQLPGKISESHLMMWAYEDWLKGAFFRIVQLLEVWCSDEIEYSRSRALDFVYGLLRSKPEQEANLLRLLVNKLGDRERKIASRASYLILQLLNLHPGMKAVVIAAVEHDVVLKPGQSLRAKYYAINTLNQTILSTKEPTTADTLLRIYFDIFLSMLKTGQLGSLDAGDNDKKKPVNGVGRKRKGRGKPESSAKPDQEEETTQKLVSSLLTGVNRAIPFTTTDDSTLEKHLDTLFRITHSSNFNTSVQALMLIQQLATSKHLAVERFYRTLYESLLDPRLINSSKQALYLNLLYRALKNDVDVRRVKAFVKRLVQVLSLHQPSFACGILFLIAELEGTFPDLHTLLDVPEDNGDEEEVYKDVTEKAPAVAPSQGEDTTQKARTTEYDGRKRDPEHSNAHRSCLWEIVPFLSHFHPSVSVFAANLLSRQMGLPKPDLANHTLMHFLDKFVYRNPKAHEAKRGSSIMQPILASGSASHLVVSSKAGAPKQVVNSASFWNLKAEDVSAEDTFFHEYFSKIGKPGEASKVKKGAKNEEGGSGDEEAEDEIWEALVNSRPEVEGDDATDGSDVDMEGYDESDEESIGFGDEAGEMSDMGSDGSGGFEGIFDDSEDDVSGSGEEEEAEEENGGASLEGERKKKRMSRSEMRSLPMFASADDYAEMLAAEEDGMAL